MRCSKVLFLIAAGFAAVFSGFIASARAEGAAFVLSEVALFNRCYFSLTGEPLPPRHPMKKQIKAGTLTAVDACMRILHLGDLVKGTANEGSFVEDSAEARSVLKNMNDFHRSWFTSDDIAKAMGGWEAYSWNWNLHDEQEAALHLTRTLFTDKANYSEIVTADSPMVALRSRGGVSGKLDQSKQPWAPDFNVYNDGVMPWSPGFVQKGQLVGIRRMKLETSILNETANGGHFPFSIPVHRHHGGGILGSQPFLLLNWGRVETKSNDGGLLVPRRWSQQLMRNLMCRELPLIRVTDAALFLQSQVTTATPGFRKAQNCMSCHASMDQMAFVARNLGSPLDSFYSAKGIGLPPVPDYNFSPLSSILAPFDQSKDALPSAYLSRRTVLDNAIAEAMNALGSYAKSGGPGAAELFHQRAAAEKLIKQGIGDAAASYSTLYAKYRALVVAAMNTPIPGLTDKAINFSSFAKDMPGGGVSGLHLSGNANSTGGFLARNPDLRTLITMNTMVEGLAESMAIAEYLIINGFTTTVMAGSAGISGINAINAFYSNAASGSFTTGSDSVVRWGYDEHDGGSIASAILMSHVYRATAACIYEFISVLKKNNLFSETVIQIGGDFSRTPNSASGPSGMTGTEHGWAGSCTSIISGVIDKPCVIGNVVADDPTGYSRGLWGLAAPLQIEGANQYLGFGNTTSTVCELLRIQRVQKNGAALVSENPSGGITPLVELAKNV